jgi:hypothetical protein
MGLASASGPSVQILGEEARLSLWFIRLLRRMVALAVSANCCALNLTVRLIVAHFHCKRFTTCSCLPHPEPNGLIHVTTSFVRDSFHATSPNSQR